MDVMFVPIQLTRTKHTLPKTKSEKETIEFIKTYRNLLDPEIINSQNYAFKAFLVPKIGNHRSSSDIAIEFVKYDESNPQEMEKYEKAIIAIKEKQVPVVNTNLYKPSDVISALRKKGLEKTIHWHTQMWQKFKVRSSSNSGEKTKTKSEYCIYDSAHNDYLYTEEWIELLIKEFSPRRKAKLPQEDLDTKTLSEI
jgi:hypothetical protein